MIYTVPHYIKGQQITQSSGQSQEITNPALGEVIGQVTFADAKMCEQAVLAAKQAFPSWAATPSTQRAHILFKFRELLIKNQESLAQLVTQEHGKTLADAQGSILRGIEIVTFNCGITELLQGFVTPNVTQHIDCETIREPLGVCVGVSPFNFPIMVPLWMMIPAIACGNTFILKPSEQNPRAPLRLMELLTEAGLPDGVVNCLQGNKDTVDYLLAHRDIQAFTAVASTPVAKHIYTSATSRGLRAHTFGGAKNHCVVMPDADLDKAAQAIVGAAYGSAGERCMALSVVVAVTDNAADALIAKMTPIINAIRINPGDEPNTDMGPLISKKHRQTVLDAIERGIQEGARLVIDGRGFTHPKHPNGFFMGPCLFDDVKSDMFIYQQELFGPVLVVLRVDDLQQAICLINQHQYGNGAAIFTQNGFFAKAFSQKVQAGLIGINVPIPVPIANHPFGGWKQSCFGDTNMHGKESIRFYTRLKTITSQWPSAAIKTSSDFMMPTHQDTSE